MPNGKCKTLQDFSSNLEQAIKDSVFLKLESQ